MATHSLTLDWVNLCLSSFGRQGEQTKCAMAQHSGSYFTLTRYVTNSPAMEHEVLITGPPGKCTGSCLKSIIFMFPTMTKDLSKLFNILAFIRHESKMIKDGNIAYILCVYLYTYFYISILFYCNNSIVNLI